MTATERVSAPEGVSAPDSDLTPLAVHKLDHIVLRVADPEASLAWYTKHFAVKVHRLAEYRAGTVPFPSIEIEPGTIIDLDGRGTRTGENMAHFALVVDELDLVELAASGRFPGSDGPYRRWGALGPGDLLYIVDPDGNGIELRHYGPSQLTA